MVSKLYGNIHGLLDGNTIRVSPLVVSWLVLNEREYNRQHHFCNLCLIRKPVKPIIHSSALQ